MDSNIDPNIDPSMESQSGLFSKFSINNDFHSHQDDTQQVHEADDFINQQYIDDNGVSSSNSANAVAVAAAANLSNIINFNHLQGLHDRSNTSSPPPSTTNARSQDNLITSPSQSNDHGNSSQGNHHDHRENSNQDPLNFIHDTLSSLDHENGSTTLHTQEQQHHHHLQQHQSPSSSSSSPSSAATTTYSKDKQPKQRIIHDSESQVSIVVVNPASNEGTRRLGRPRKNIPKQTNSPANSSTQNLDKSLLSRFRFDSLPVIGPGSRGGRKKKNGIITKPGRQARFEKGSKELKLVVKESSEELEESDVKAIDETSSIKKDDEDDDADLIVVDEVKNQTPKSQPKIILEDYYSLKAKGRSTAKDTNNAFTKLGLAPQTNKPQPVIKKRKDTPGAIVGAYYDIYEPELVDRNHNDRDMNMIALGYEVTPAPYAKDIMTILEFTNKFKSIFSEFHNLGPQDFEEGLKLRPSTAYPLDNAKQSTKEKLYDDGDEDDVSQLMNNLLYQLLTLVLNRKRPIDQNGLTRALEDLNKLVLSFGLPSEWRDDSQIFNNPKPTIVQEQEDEPVDPENSEILDSTHYKFDTTKPLAHTPLDNENFEIDGLIALEPKDRLIFFRSLVQWCLSNSDIIKQELASQLSRQESSGEKETYYISRFIKDGSKGIETALQEKSVIKRKKQKIEGKESQTPEPKEPSSELLNTNPTVNPLDHHMSFRLLDFYAGDGGINGRFYLCRSANSKTGGLASYQEITSILEDSKSIHDLLTNEQPSRFKLYVQDVTTMLSEVYKLERSDEELLDPWYEIAGNTEELNDFLQYLSEKLKTNRSKQLNNLYNHLNALLPILVKYETLQKDYRPTRSSRKREQVTNYRENDKKLKQMLAEEGEEDEFLNNDSEDEEDEGFGLVEADDDDDDDDDYKE